MKKLILSMFILLALFVYKEKARGDDVYNFYFQKSPSASQTGNPANAPNTPAAAPTPTEAPAAVPNKTSAPTPTPETKESESSPTHFSLNIGYDVVGGTGDDAIAGFSGGIEWTPIAWLGFDAQILTANGRNAGSQGSVAKKIDDRYAAGLMLNPIHASWFTGSFLIGAMTYSSFDPGSVEPAKKVGPYAGVGLSFNFNPNLSLIAQGRYLVVERSVGDIAAVQPVTGNAGFAFRF